MRMICDADGLERVVGGRPLPALLKSIDTLDEHCAVLLARAPLAVLGYTDLDARPQARVVGGAPGFATIAAPTRLAVPVPADAAPGCSVSLLLLVPGWRETLRINGRYAGAEEPLHVEEAFVHCGKAVIRSGLWGPDRVTGPAPLDARAFLAATPFLVITSQDGSGAADASPKATRPGSSGCSPTPPSPCPTGRATAGPTRSTTSSSSRPWPSRPSSPATTACSN